MNREVCRRDRFRRRASRTRRTRRHSLPAGPGDQSCCPGAAPQRTIIGRQRNCIAKRLAPPQRAREVHGIIAAQSVLPGQRGCARDERFTELNPNHVVPVRGKRPVRGRPGIPAQHLESDRPGERGSHFGTADDRSAEHAALRCTMLTRMKKAVNRTNQVLRRVEHPIVDFFEGLTQSDMNKAAERKLASMKFPRYESHPRHSGVLVEVHTDGRRVFGCWDMKRNTFVPTTP